MVTWNKFESKNNSNNNNSELKKFRFDEFCSINGYFKKFAQNPKYPSTWYLIIENDDGNWIINCPAHLKSLMMDLTSSEEHLLCEGTRILVKYCSDKYVGKPKPMKVFEVYIAEE